MTDNNRAITSDLTATLRTLDLTSVACSASIDEKGVLGTVNLTGKTEAATRRYHLGLLDGLVIAEAAKGVDQRLLDGEGDVLPVKKAATFAEAILRFEELSRPHRMVVEQVKSTFEIVGIAEQPFDGDTYQRLPLLKRVPRDRLLHERRVDESERDSDLRDLALERWEERLFSDGAEYEEKAVRLEEALRDRSGGGSTRLLVVGPPGSGKSTVLNHIAYACLHGNPPLTIGGGRYLPVKIGLRRWEVWCKDHHRYTLAEYLADTFAGHGLPMTALWQQWLAAGRLLVLLDGLDELGGDPDFYDQALRGFLADRNLSRCPAILTCRTVSFEAHWRLSPDLPVYVLGGMNPRQQAVFIRHYPALPGSGFDPEGLIAELRRLPNLRPLAANPLLLSVLCLVASGPRGVELPTTRGALYEAAIMRILRLTTTSPRVPSIYLGVTEPRPPEKKFYLEELALELWLEERSRELIVEEAALLRALKSVLVREGDVIGLARCLQLDWTANSGLLRRGEDGRCAWLHLTLQEYLVANALARRLNDNALGGWRGAAIEVDGRELGISDLVLNHAWDGTWQEVICLLAGRMERPEEMLRVLLEEPDDACHLMLLMAGRCLAEVRTEQAKELRGQSVIRLLGVLRSASTVDGDRAGKVLGRMTGEEVVAGLGEALGDTNSDIRRAAARALGQLADPAAIPALLRSLGDPDSIVRHLTTEALGQIGVAAVAVLRRTLTDSDKTVRTAIAEAFEKICDTSAAPDLRRLLRDADAVVRCAATGALGRIGGRSAIPALLAALADPEGDVRCAAAGALGRIGGRSATPALLAALADPRGDVRCAAVEALGRIGGRSATPALLVALADPEGDVRCGAATELGRIGDRAATPALLAALADPEGDVRRAAAEALGQIGDPTAVPSLLGALADPHTLVRDTAAEALGEIGDLLAVPGLLQALTSYDSESRIHALHALGLIADPASIPAIVCVLADPDDSVCASAAEALGLIGGQAAITALLRALEQVDWVVRRYAAEALGRIGDPVAVPALRRALADSEESVRGRAAEALGRIGDPAAIPALRGALADSKEYVRGYAVKGLGWVATPAAVSSLIGALKHDRFQVRSAAAEELGWIGDPKAVPALLQALKDPRRHVRADAAEALGGIGAPTAIPALLQALSDPAEVVHMAVSEALYWMIQPAAEREGFYRLVMDPKRWARRSAVVALGRGTSTDDLADVLSAILISWQKSGWDDNLRGMHYDMLIRLTQNTWPGLAEIWHGLRHDMLPPTVYALATGLAQRPKWAREAEAAYRRVLGQLPDFSPASSGLARLLMRWPGHASQACSVLEDRLRRCTSDPSSWNWLGCGRRLMGDDAHALEAFRQAARYCTLPADRATFLCECGSICLDLGQTAEAEGYLREAEVRGAPGTFLLCLRARLQLVRVDFHHSLKTISLAVQDEDAPPASYLLSGLILLANGACVEAKAAYSRGLQQADWQDILLAMKELATYQEREGALPGAEEVFSYLQKAHDRLVASWPPAPS